MALNDNLSGNGGAHELASPRRGVSFGPYPPSQTGFLGGRLASQSDSTSMSSQGKPLYSEALKSPPCHYGFVSTFAPPPDNRHGPHIFTLGSGFMKARQEELLGPAISGKHCPNLGFPPAPSHMNATQDSESPPPSLGGQMARWSVILLL